MSETEQPKLAGWIPGGVIRALGSLVDSDAVHEACRVVHVAPSETPEQVRAEAIHGCVFVRAELMTDTLDEGVTIDTTTAARFTPDDFVRIEGRTIAEPVVVQIRGDGPTDMSDGYPDLAPLVPTPDQRILFCVSPKDMVRALRTMVGCGATSVEVLAPPYKGGPLGLRATIPGGVVHACIMPRAPLDGPAQRDTDVEGQATFDFRVNDTLVDAAVEAAVESLRPKRGSGVKSVTISSPQIKKSVTLLAEDESPAAAVHPQAKSQRHGRGRRKS